MNFVSPRVLPPGLPAWLAPAHRHLCGWVERLPAAPPSFLMAQLLTHQASNGCKLQPGDLLGTGTQSGPEPGQGGSLLELSDGGKQALTLPNGEQRRFLADGDQVILRAACERPGTARIGFGDCAGTVLPAPE